MGLSARGAGCFTRMTGSGGVVAHVFGERTLARGASCGGLLAPVFAVWRNGDG